MGIQIIYHHTEDHHISSSYYSLVIITNMNAKKRYSQDSHVLTFTVYKILPQVKYLSRSAHVFRMPYCRSNVRSYRGHYVRNIV